MMTYRQFWQVAAEKLLPQGRRQKKMREEIEAKSNQINEFSFKNMSVLERNDFIKKTNLEIKKLVAENERITDRDLERVVKYNEKFLKNAIEGWDFIDLMFVMTAVAVNINLSKIAFDEDWKTAIHDEHSGKAAVNRLGNAAHHKMPNDTVPDGHMGIDNRSNSPGRSFKIPGVEDSIGINHRYIYGHDIFKFWEIFKNSGDIEDVVPIRNSRALGVIVKQTCHLWCDLFTPTGVPAPGTTYFTKSINKKLSKEIREYNDSPHPGLPNKTMSEEMQKFAIHIEDVIKSVGIEMLIQKYCMTRRSVKEGDNFFDWLEKFLLFDIEGFAIKNRAFKEYEIGMMIHLNVIIIAAMKREIAHLSIDAFLKDMIQWLRLNRKWNAEYRKLLIKTLQDIETCKIPEELLSKCKVLCEEYNIEFKNDAHYIIENLEKN